MPYRYSQFAHGRQAKHSQAPDNFSNGSNSNNLYGHPNGGAAFLATNGEDTDMSIGFTTDQSRGGAAPATGGNAYSSSSNNSSSSSGSCFPIHKVSMPRRHRRRRSVTTECSSEDLKDIHEAEAIDDQEPDMRGHYRPRHVPFEASNPEMLDHVVACVVPSANPYFQMQHFPLDPDYVRMQQQQNPMSMEAPYPSFEGMVNPAIPLSGGQSMSEFGPPQELAAQASHPLLSHPLPPHQPQATNNAEAFNIFTRPTGPMMPILHERSPLPPIIFNVNSQEASAPSSLPAQHRTTNHFVGMPQMMPNPNPQNLPQGPQSVCTLTVNPNGNDRGFSNVYIPDCHPLRTPPTASEGPIQANVFESKDSPLLNPKPSYASMLK
ncbi:uncharacterized protein [Drosophila tropicalis]|uniref:uncharacterized protein isoform X8 n=1 Tax=Drosophila tropicalis TaxID=46794 RepID=UPI0035ABED3D